MAMPAVGALCASLVIVIVAALLETDFGRGLADDLDAPVRALVAVPVLVLAGVLFAVSVLALVLPAGRPKLLAAAGITGWLIPAWLVVAGVLLACVSFGLDRIS
ncbi:MAG: hypothetical protein EXQ70_04770 [Solirubrobacterales bacterium]|nr:hypothetical protein [Solirubrobacterales bacterium]